MVEETVAQVSATDLKPGMWIDRDGPVEVLLAQTFTDDNGPGVYITQREIGGGMDSFTAEATEAFDLVPDSRIAELQKTAERTHQIAQLQALTVWLKDNPWVPMPNMPHQIDLHGDDGYVTLLKLAARLDAQVDERATSRTEATFKAAGVRLEVIAWHAQGRPQLAVDPDPRGLAYTRADSEADDPTPVSPARVPMHTGGMTAEGLVDETLAPVWHFSEQGNWTACALLVGGSAFPMDEGWTNTGAHVTCKACLDSLAL